MGSRCLTGAELEFCRMKRAMRAEGYFVSGLSLTDNRCEVGTAVWFSLGLQGGPQQGPGGGN